MAGIPGLLTSRQLAQALDVPFSTLQAKLQILRRDHGFPHPVPCMGGRYDPIAVAEWRRRQAGIVAALAAADALPPNEDGALAGWHAELDKRAAQIARPAGRA